MNVLEPYDKVLTTHKRYIMIKSGRDAGKSKFSAQFIVKNFYEHNLNILVCRSSYGDLKDSMFQEINDVLEEEHLIQFTESRTRPLKIINKLNGNIIYFKGVGGADLSRTKGFKTSKKLSLIMFDELQQLPSQANLDQALATFRRHLDAKEGRVLMCFNPEPQKSHWCNEYYRIHTNDPKYLTLHTSYKDIAGVLSDVDLEAIETERVLNNDYYRYLYLGETDGLFGTVYHTFNRDIHLIDRDRLNELVKEFGVYQLLVGVDSAVTRDRVAVVPLLMLRNGQCIVTEYFYHNPQKNGQLSDERLVTKYIYPFLEEIETKYELDIGRKPIHLVVDSANANVVRTLNYHNVRRRYRIWAYTQKKIFEMARIVQDAFSKNVVYVLDTGGIYNYVTHNKEVNYHPLVTALESVIWDEKGKGFDPIVPNDSTDALTYALATYYKNPHNLSFPTRYSYYEHKT